MKRSPEERKERSADRLGKMAKSRFGRKVLGLESKYHVWRADKNFVDRDASERGDDETGNAIRERRASKHQARVKAIGRALENTMKPSPASLEQQPPVIPPVIPEFPAYYASGAEIGVQDTATKPIPPVPVPPHVGIHTPHVRPQPRVPVKGQGDGSRENPFVKGSNSQAGLYAATTRLGGPIRR